MINRLKVRLNGKASKPYKVTNLISIKKHIFLK